jgi:predicted RNase H-like HicB family nuclease
MTKEQSLPVDIEIDEDRIYVVSCPTFRGCHAAGKTINEALVELREVVEMCTEEQSET